MIVKFEETSVRNRPKENIQTERAEFSPSEEQEATSPWVRGRYERFTSKIMDRCSVWMRVKWPKLCGNIWKKMDELTGSPGMFPLPRHGAPPSNLRTWYIRPNGAGPDLPFVEHSQLVFDPRPNSECVAVVMISSRP